MTSSRCRTPRFRRDRSASQPTVLDVTRPDTVTTGMSIRQRRCFSCSRHAMHSNPENSSASKPEEDAVETTCDIAINSGPNTTRGHYAASAPSLLDDIRLDKKRPLLSPKLTVITEHPRAPSSCEQADNPIAQPVPITQELLRQIKEPLPVEKDLGIVRWIRTTEALRACPNKNGLTFLPHLWQPAIIENS